MNLSRVLDQTILDPPPPFPPLDVLIARERRRARRRQLGAAIGAAAAVIAVAIGAQALSPAGGPDMAPAEPSTWASPTASTPAPSLPTSWPTFTPADEDRLTQLLHERVSAVLPGATVAPGMDQGAIVWRNRLTGDSHYAPEADVRVVTQEGWTHLGVLVMLPKAAGPTPSVFDDPLGPIYHYCDWLNLPQNVAKEQFQGSCEERPGPAGSTVTAYSFDGGRTEGAVIVFPNGAAVAASSKQMYNATAPPLAIPRVIEIISDPAFAS